MHFEKVKRNLQVKLLIHDIVEKKIFHSSENVWINRSQCEIEEEKNAL